MCATQTFRRIVYSFLAITFLSLAWGSHLCAQAELDFIARRDSKTKGSVVAQGDFNGDRHLDLVTAQESMLSILLGTGDGRFTAGRDVRAGGTPVAVTVGDFNGDRRLDLATANGAGTISVLLGLGDGSFRAARNFRVGGPPNSIAVDDFNGDGRQDLATANGDAGTVSILLGLGDGTFRATRNLRVGGAPGGLTVGDFNGDGRQDMAVANGEGPWTISVFLGKGNGTFQLAVDTDVGAPLGSIAVGDFNGDGRQDLAVTAGDISVLLGKGNGTFQVQQIAAPSLGGGFYFVRTGDFNGDGYQDLAVPFFNCSTVGYGCFRGVDVLLSRGDGTFPERKSFEVQSLAPLTVGDFNGDGRQDLAIDTGSGFVSILLGHGDGSFRDVQGAQGEVQIGDFNGDGRSDLASLRVRCFFEAESCQSSGGILLSKGDGTFESGAEFGVRFEGLGLSMTFTVGDFNGDGYQDLALHAFKCDMEGGGCFGGVDVLLSRGDGTFQEPRSFRVGSRVGLTVGDFNGDGRQDLAIANESGFGVVGGSVSIFLSKGDGTFRMASVLARRPGPVMVGDFNGDGRQDLAMADSSSTNVFIFLGNGNGTFQAARNLGVGTQPSSVTVGDFNGDGRQDLATTNAGSNTISILLSYGDGTFQPALTVEHEANSISVADFDGDGRQDLAAFNSGHVSILLGRGDGTFESARDFGAGGGFGSGVVADFNGDGLPDIVTDSGILINNSHTKDAIDVIPTRSANKATPSSSGAIPVAIKTTASLDARPSIHGLRSGPRQEGSADRGCRPAWT